MIVTTSYSSQLRAKMTPADWEAIRTAGPGEVRFSRGIGGVFCCTIIGTRTVSAVHRTEPMAAFRQALAELRPEIVSVLRG